MYTSDLRLTIGGDDVPRACVDQCEHRSAWVRVGSLCDIQIGHVSIKRCDDTATHKVEPRAIDPRRQTWSLRLKNIQGIDNMNRLAQPCPRFGRLIVGLLLAKSGLGLLCPCLTEGGHCFIVVAASYPHSGVRLIHLVYGHILFLE